MYIDHQNNSKLLADLGSIGMAAVSSFIVGAKFAFAGNIVSISE